MYDSIKLLNIKYKILNNNNFNIKVYKINIIM